MKCDQTEVVFLLTVTGCVASVLKEIFNRCIENGFFMIIYHWVSRCRINFSSCWPLPETFCGARTAVNKSVVIPKAIVEEVPFY